MASVPFKSTAISGSIERTTSDVSYLVAGSNITITTESNGQLTIASTGGGGTPGGADSQVQFNSNGAFQASDKLTFVATGSADSTGLLTLTGSLAVLSGSTEGGINMQRGGGSIAIGKNAFATPSNIASYRAGNFSQGYAVSGGYIKSDGAGSFAQGVGSGANIKAESLGSFAQGTAFGGNITANNVGSFAQGSASTNPISATALGTFAQGHSFGGAIAASGNGSFAQGRSGVAASGEASFAQGSNHILAALSRGTFAQGWNRVTSSAEGAFSQGYGPLVASGKGSFAHGFVNNASYNITAAGQGSFATGYNSSGYVFASSKGSFVAGFTRAGRIRASAYGSFAHGYTYGNGNKSFIDALAKGSHASGYVWDAGGHGYVIASGEGSFAHGWVYSDATNARVQASGRGSTAFGAALNDGSVLASGVGSFAAGYADTYTISATAYNSAQFGQGTNAIPSSLQVGSKTALGGKAIRIIRNLTAASIANSDAGDISTQLRIVVPDGSSIPAAANETKFVFSGSIIEQHAGVPNFAEGEFSGEMVYFGGGSLTAGRVYYLAPGGSWSVARSDASSAMSGSLLGVALGTGTAAQKGVLLRGFYQLPSTPNTGSYTVGAPMYVATGSTDGFVIDSPPGGTGQVVRIAGHCVASDGLLWFNPDGNFIINS
jgi:hypothetical protein